MCRVAVAADSPEAEAVEAAFIYRFAGYVEWPPESVSHPEFTIAVLGADKVAQELLRILPQHQIKDSPARVRRIRRMAELGDSQILFIGPQYDDDLQSVIAQVANRPVLVVTAGPHGLEDGSCVNFLFIDRHVRFEVSITAAEHVGLRISAELLSVAVRIQGRSLGNSPAAVGAR